VEMMRNERDRQYREDVQILVVSAVDSGKKATDSQQQTNHVLKSATEVDDVVTTEDLQEAATLAAESEYEDNSDHNALRFVRLSIKQFFYVLDSRYIIYRL